VCAIPAAASISPRTVPWASGWRGSGRQTASSWAVVASSSGAGMREPAGDLQRPSCGAHVPPLPFMHVRGGLLEI
jgi:hypothetical protein